MWGDVKFSEYVYNGLLRIIYRIVILFKTKFRGYVAS